MIKPSRTGCSKHSPEGLKHDGNQEKRYEIYFDEYIVFMYHPVTTELDELPSIISEIVDALIESGKNYIVIYPNNGHGSEVIIKELERLRFNFRFRVFPSVRFECFLTLLKNTALMIGNSSAGVREVPFYGKPSINLGTRQNNRAHAISIFNVEEKKECILNAIQNTFGLQFEPSHEFGDGNSDQRFLNCLQNEGLWNIPRQKTFVDLTALAG